MLIFEENTHNENTSLSDLTEHELLILKKLLQSKDLNENLDAQHMIGKLLSPYVADFNYEIYNPHWLYESTFEDNVWLIKNIKKINRIDFENILIENKVKLVDVPELLYLFKVWISLAISPRTNSGKILKPNTTIQIINRISTLIDAIIINSSRIQLLKRKFLAIDTNFFNDLIFKISKFGVEIGVYDYFEIVKIYLRANIQSITELDLIDFEKKYPHKDSSGNNLLNLSNIEIRKSKVYLYRNNAYKVELSKKISVNSGYFNKLYKNTIAYKNMRFPILEELTLEPIEIRKEYKSVPVRNINNNLTINQIEGYISKINLLNNVFYHLEKNIRNITYPKLEVDINTVTSEIEEIQNGRYTTLPSEVVFKAFKDAFHYLHENLDQTLDNFTKVLIYYKNNKLDPKFSLKKFKSSDFNKVISYNFKNNDLLEWNIERDQFFFEKLRENKSLAHSYYLTFSSLSIVIGTIMARRQSEIIQLNPISSLYPPNLDPLKDKTNQFYLSIKNKKSGVGGKYNINENLLLPIPASIATFIYKIQEFNLKLIKENIVNINEIKLINSFNKHNLKIRKINQSTYNFYLDYFCDYFETKVINTNINTKKRFYIREHQLRRFFAMLFFWSRSFDGLDSLSQFLGHTNTEHLYNYISENTNGEVLYGVKARYIYENYNLDKENQLYIENIEKLEPIIKKYFNLSSIDLMPEAEAFNYYKTSLNDNNYIKSADSLEEKFFILLKNHVIDLKPTFFSIKDRTQNIHLRSFKLILEVDQIYE